MNFENEDQVFQYLRMKSKQYYSQEINNANPDDTGDHSGRIDTAIKWFIDDAYQGSLAEKEKIKNNLTILNKKQLKEDPGKIDILESINDYSFGLSLGWVYKLNNGEYVMTKTGHAVTVNGLIVNPNEKKSEDRYLGIIIADSDNTPRATDETTFDLISNSAFDIDIRRTTAAQQPNIYTTYELELKDYKNLVKLWTLVGYVIEVSDYAFQAVIRGITALKDKDALTDDSKTQAEESDKTNDDGSENNPDESTNPGNPNPNTSKPSSPTIPEVPIIIIEEPTWTEEENATNYNQPETAHVIQDGIDYTAIKEFMTKEDWLLYSPKNWKYSSSKDTTFRVYVRTSITSLSEIQLDNALLGEEDFETTECMDGLFLLVLNEQKMKSLSEGEHDLRILLNGYEQQTRTITVK